MDPNNLYNICFICVKKTTNPQELYSLNYDKSSFVLYHIILDLPHLYDDNDSQFQLLHEKVYYCKSCSDQIINIQTVLEKLYILEKEVLKLKDDMELKLKESCDLQDQTYHNSEPFQLISDYRNHVIQELDKNRMLAMLKKLNNKQVGKQLYQKCTPRIMKNVQIPQHNDELITADNSPHLNIFYNEREEEYSDKITAQSRQVESQPTTYQLPYNTLDQEVGSLLGKSEPGILTDISKEAVVEPTSFVHSEPMIYVNTENDFNCEPFSFIQHMETPVTETECIENISKASDSNFVMDEIFVCDVNNGEELMDNKKDIKIPNPSSWNFIPINENSVDSHEYANTDKEIKKSFICGGCGQKFDNYMLLKNHDKLKPNCCIITHVKQHSKINQNKKSQGNIQKFKMTSKKSSVIISTRIKCDECTKTFANKNSWRNHLKSVHRDQATFRCSICNLGCLSRYTLNNHMISHTNERSFKCHLCIKDFKYKEHLTRHLRSFHAISPNGIKVIHPV